jgi:hypothetical protein
MDFSQPYVASVEQALENQAQLRGRWRRLNSVELNASATKLHPVTGWVIALPPRTVACSGATELWVLLDTRFPNSQPHIVAPGICEDGSWPHVEDEGCLCLGKSEIATDAGDRIMNHLVDALELLNYDEAKRKSEFQAEVSTYWSRGENAGTTPKHRSLVTPGGPSREVWRYYDSKQKLHIWADSKEQLIDWLRNARYNPGVKEIVSAWAVWLPEAPIPPEFPVRGSDVLAHIPQTVQQKLISPGVKLPVLIGTSTDAGPVWLAAELDIGSESELTKGFRPGRFPFSRAFNSMATRPIHRLQVERIDGRFVHGRDRNNAYEDLSKVRVAIIGCGALGSAIAKLLAQAGVGSFVLVDPDVMKAHNTSRHVVGASGVGVSKVKALAGRLELDFPHQGPHKQLEARVEALTPNQWVEISKCDLIVSAGIDLSGDSALAAWRIDLEMPPPHICTWVEPYAIAGHAIALFENDDLRAAFDTNGYPDIRMTVWSPDTAIEFREAGCGNVFQPHGAIDLQRTALTGANLCLDVIEGAVTGSVRRTWQGDLGKLAALGGAPNPAFDRSNTETVWPWAPAAPAGVAL